MHVLYRNVEFCHIYIIRFSFILFFHVGQTNNGGFSLDSCRSMVALMDVSYLHVQQTLLYGHIKEGFKPTILHEMKLCMPLIKDNLNIT